MTREEAIKFLENIKVYVDGKSKEIQEKLFSLGFSWYGGLQEIRHVESPFLYTYADGRIIAFGENMNEFMEHENFEISTKEILSIELTEPTYRPFKSKEECWNEMLKHQPFGWLKAKNSGNAILIGGVSMSKEVWIVWATDETESYSASKVFNNYVFADGTPFGIKED